MHDGSWRHRLFRKKRERAQGIGIKLPRDGDESAIRLVCAQDIEMARSLSRKARRCETGAGSGPGKGVGVFGTIEKREVARTRAIEGGDIADAMIQPTPDRTFAPVSSAISRKVSPADLKNIGSLMLRLPKRMVPKSGLPVSGIMLKQTT